MAIPKGQKKNFKTLQRAIRNGDVALLETFDTKTNEVVDSVCATMTDEQGNVTFVPLAIMVREDPYQRFRPPV